MKPSWYDAPEWANWLAMDENGEWHWFELKPDENVGCYNVYYGYFWPTNGGRHELAGLTRFGETLEQRPKT